MPSDFFSIIKERPVLKLTKEGKEALEVGLDAERRTLMRINTERLMKYKEASTNWASAWPEVSIKIQGLSLKSAHEIVVAEAEKYLPKSPLL